MPRLSGRDLTCMGLRASLLQATWNYERQQGLGWAWAIKPAIDRVYPDPDTRALRLAEHTAFFNTQPTLASLVLGAVAGLEERRAAGEGPGASEVSHVKNVLGSSAAAVGDRLFWFTLRPFAACLGVLLALRGSWWGAVALWLCYNALHQTVRLLGVRWGYRAGPSVLSGPLRGRLEGLIHALSVMGAALVGVLVAALLAPVGWHGSFAFQVLVVVGLSFGIFSAQRARPSPTAWALVIGALCIAVAWLR